MNDIALKFVFFQGYYPHIAALALCFLKSTALLVLALALTTFLRSRSARARSWIWRITFVGLAALVVFQFAPAALQAVRPKVSVLYHQETARSFTESVTALRLMRDGPSANRLVESRQREKPPEPAPPWELRDQQAITIADYRPQPWAGIEASLPWVLGGVALSLIVFVILRTLVGSTLLWRHSTAADKRINERAGLMATRLGLRRAGHVRISKQIGAPILLGLYEPLIYVPNEAAAWETKKLDTVFIHEFAHWRRGDFLWLQFARTILAAFWWNPLLRFALSRMNAEAEEAADDMVILDQSQANDYARTLVEIAAADGGADRGLGVSMLGYRRLEHRVRRILQDNRWRGKLGRFAAGAIAIAGLLFTGVSSFYLAMASPQDSSPQVKKPVISSEMRPVAERIIARNKQRLEKLRFTHAKLESFVRREMDGQTITAPTSSKIEVWNDLWTNIHRVEYRPQVSIWEQGAAPFFIANYNDICDGKKSYYYESNEIPDEGRSSPARPVFIDYLGVQAATDIIRMLGVLLQSAPAISNEYHCTFEYVEWKGRQAVRLQEAFLREDKIQQQRTFIVVPDANDLITVSKLHFPQSQNLSSWEAEEISTLPGTAISYATKFSNAANSGKSDTTTRITELEVLTALPSNIADLPKSPELQYIAKDNTVQQPDQVEITCVDPTSGAAVADAQVKVQINEQKSEKLRTDAAGRLMVPLPKNEVTYLSVRALKSGFVGRHITWRKYGNPLRLPASYQIQMAPGTPISGRVVDEAGLPLADATVYMSLSGLRHGVIACLATIMPTSKPKRKPITWESGRWPIFPPISMAFPTV